jgi:methyltransferase
MSTSLCLAIMFTVFLLTVAFVPMVAEAVRSRRNERALLAAGAVEPADDVYAVMQVIYPACFAAMAVENWVGGRTVKPMAIAGGILFALAKGLKYWAIASLGVRWTFRVLVPPHSELTVAGPYRFLRHPNYLAVAGELAGMALLARAPISGTVALMLFGSLMLARIRVEERALGLRRE